MWTVKQKCSLRNNYRLEIKKFAEKAERLIEMRLNGEIDRDTYLRLKATVDADKKQAEQQLLDYESLPRVAQSHPFTKAEIKKHLLDFASSNNIDFDENIIDKFVTQIKVECETEFSWFIDIELNSRVVDKCQKIVEFTIPYKDALKFRTVRKEILRKYQYLELNVKIFF